MNFIKVKNKNYYFMQLWGDCSNLGYLGRARDHGPIDNVYSVLPENIELLLENKYETLILNTAPKETPRYPNFEGDSTIEYDYGYVKILHNNPKEDKYKQELHNRILKFNSFYENLKIKNNYYFTVNFNDELVFQKDNTLKSAALSKIINILQKYQILDKVIFVGLNQGSTLWASNMHLKEINKWISEYNLKYIEIFENDIWKTEKSENQFKNQFLEGLSKGSWLVDRQKLFPVNKVFGIISYFPDIEPDRTNRQNRLNRLLRQLEELWPEIDILIIAQNWKDFKPYSTKNKQIILNYPALGILGARKELRVQFLALEYNYIIMFDDDAIIEYLSAESIMDYIKLIEEHPHGFAFVKGVNNPYNPYAAAQLNLCAISRAIYALEDMVNVDPQKSEGFEDCIYATLLHYKYGQYEFDIPEGLRCSQYFNQNEPIKSTWWDSNKKNATPLINNTNALCKYISENRKMPENVAEFLRGLNNKIKIVPNYYNKYTGKYTPEPFTGLTEEWWKEDF